MSESGGMSQLVELRESSDVLTITSAGGSGFGDPPGRPTGLIERDIEEEYVTADGLAAYGARAAE